MGFGEVVFSLAQPMGCSIMVNIYILTFSPIGTAPNAKVLHSFILPTPRPQFSFSFSALRRWACV